MAVVCKECKLEVVSHAALVAHWQEQLGQGKGHYHCSQCMLLFHTPQAHSRHHKEFHPTKQDLVCPGCDAQFVAAGGLIDHIERNRCNRIKNADFAARREEKLAFARELQRRHRGADPGFPDNLSAAGLSLAGSTATRQEPYNFTQHLSKTRDIPTGNSSLSALRPKAENTVRPNPVTFAMKEVDFPQLAPQQSRRGIQLDVLFGDRNDGKEERIENLWAQGKKLFPDSPAPVRPGPEQLETLQQPPWNKETAWAPHDPRNPGWEPMDYFVPYTKKYKCPHERCPKSFGGAAGLRAHLTSPTHAGPIRVQCPRCCRWFDSMAAITQHAESQGVRCNIRETEGYRQFLDQLTAGIVDTTEKNEDGTEKYTVPEEARKAFGTLQGTQHKQAKDGEDGWQQGWW